MPVARQRSGWCELLEYCELGVLCCCLSRHLVYGHWGIIKLAPHIDDETERKLRNFPFLETDGAIREFCNTHTNKRLIDWWKHKISYRWLLPSLNRYLSKMKNSHFDFIPNDTNAIEGSHAADNRIDRTNHTLLEAMLLRRKSDGEEGRIINASLSASMPENKSNSLRAWFSAKAGRDAGKRAKKDADVPAFKAQLKKKDLEIADLRAQVARAQHGTQLVNSHASTLHSIIAQSEAVADIIDVDMFEPRTPLRRPIQPTVFSRRSPVTPTYQAADSDFDWNGALDSDIMDLTFTQIAGVTPSRSTKRRGKAKIRKLYAVRGVDEDEVVASDPYPSSP
ncbi:hypothetical protein C8F01DRAFT_1332895 [Mycena amicta]|nr:hypothetical protein C8F01DRAFT_1332895 [Mycena amicta]